MVYPPAPWTLQGKALITAHLIDTQLARQVVPPELDIISVLPGKTTGAVYLSYYQSGSTLEYHELIVSPALVRCHNRVGGWVSHIYVDHPDSVAGGREIWGMPKELAEFDWTAGQVSVYQQGTLLCSLDYEKPWFKFPNALQPTLPGYVVSRLHQNWIGFENLFRGPMEWVNSHLVIPAASPFSLLALKQPFLTVHYPELYLQVKEPHIIQ